MTEKKSNLCIKNILVVLIGLLSIACSSPEEPPQITLGAPTSALSSIIWLADELDLFKQYDVNIKVKQYPSGKEALAAMLSGDIDLAATAETPFAVALFSNKSIRLFASIGQNDNEIHVLARKDHGIYLPQDLKGKTIATQEGSAVHFFLSSFLLHHQIHTKDLKTLFMRANALPVALIQGEVDAISIREPHISQVMNSIGADNLVKFSVPGLYTKTYIIAGHKDIISKHPGVVNNFLLALNKASEFSYANPRHAKKIISEKFSVTADQINQLWRNMRLGITLNQTLVYTLEEETQWAIDTGQVEAHNPDASPPLYILNYIDPLPLTNTVPYAVSLIGNKHNND